MRNQQKIAEFANKVNQLAKEYNLDFVMSIPNDVGTKATGSYIACNMDDFNDILCSMLDTIQYFLQGDSDYDFCSEQVRAFQHAVDDVCDDTRSAFILSSILSSDIDDFDGAGDDNDPEEEENNPEAMRKKLS